MFNDLETWEYGALWPALEQEYKVTAAEDPSSSLDLFNTRISRLGQSVHEAVVLAEKTLTAFGAPLNNAGDRVLISHRRNDSFRLPEDPTRTPIICIAADSGLAPFRGFIQERIRSKPTFAPAFLYFGCRNAGQDDIYADELAKWESSGAVQLYRAFSQAPQESANCKYIQARFNHEREAVIELWKAGAHIYVRGSREVGRALEQTFMAMAMSENINLQNKSLEGKEAREWLDGI